MNLTSQPVRQKQKRVKNPAYLAWLRTVDCIMPHKRGKELEGNTQAAHVRTAANSGIGVKPDDRHANPLCQQCHAYQHQHGQAALLDKFYGGDEPWTREEATDWFLKSANEFYRMFRRTNGIN